MKVDADTGRLLAARHGALISGDGEHASFVYGIKFTKEGHPHTGLIRYVGKSRNPMRRFRRHMRERSASHIHRSARAHGTSCFALEILEQCNADTPQMADAAALAREIHWIQTLHTANGKHGLNLTRGGEGTVLTDEIRALHAPKRREMLNAIKRRPEVSEKLRAIARSRAQEPTYGAQCAAILKRTWERPEYRANQAEARRRWHSDPENQKKHAERVRQQSQRTEVRKVLRDRLRAMNKDPVIRAKIHATQRRMYAENPALAEAKAMVARALHQDPDYRRRRADGIKAKQSDPAYVAHRVALTKANHAKSPAFGRSAIIGIHLHWHKVHSANGKFDAAEKQLASLRVHLGEALKASETSKVIGHAKEYLAAIGAAKIGGLVNFVQVELF